MAFVSIHTCFYAIIGLGNNQQKRLWYNSPQLQDCRPEIVFIDIFLIGGIQCDYQSSTSHAANIIMDIFLLTEKVERDNFIHPV